MRGTQSNPCACDTRRRMQGRPSPLEAGLDNILMSSFGNFSRLLASFFNQPQIILLMLRPQDYLPENLSLSDIPSICLSGPVVVTPINPKQPIHGRGTGDLISAREEHPSTKGYFENKKRATAKPCSRLSLTVNLGRSEQPTPGRKRPTMVAHAHKFDACCEPGYASLKRRIFWARSEFYLAYGWNFFFVDIYLEVPSNASVYTYSDDKDVTNNI